MITVPLTTSLCAKLTPVTPSIMLGLLFEDLHANRTSLTYSVCAYLC